MNKRVALFKISKAFTILTIGQVIAGQLLEGQINIGDLLEVIINDAVILFSVKALGALDGFGKPDQEMGLRVEPVNVAGPVNFETYSALTVPVFAVA